MPLDRDVLNMGAREIRESLGELLRLTSRSYSELSVDEKYSTRYNVIVLVEALVALCIHLARELYGYTPRSYSDAVRYSCSRLGLRCVDDLVTLVRLRNLLIHRYWVIDDHMVYQSIKGDFRCLEEFLRVLKEGFAR